MWSAKGLRQFHQSEEPFLVYNGEPAIGGRASGSAAGRRVDERHLTEHGDRQDAHALTPKLGR